jgi:hypothetical protein
MVTHLLESDLDISKGHKIVEINKYKKSHIPIDYKIGDLREIVKASKIRNLLCPPEPHYRIYASDDEDEELALDPSENTFMDYIYIFFIGSAIVFWVIYKSGVFTDYLATIPDPIPWDTKYNGPPIFDDYDEPGWINYLTIIYTMYSLMGLGFTWWLYNKYKGV